MSLLDKIRNSRCIQVCVYAIIATVYIAGILSDWLLYYDLNRQEGLVFGPTDQTLLYCVLAFCCIGALILVVQLINTGCEIFRNEHEAPLDPIYVMTFALWFEELPQIWISVIIAGCREEGVSIFQLVKASVVIVSCLWKLLYGLIRYCLNKRQGKEVLKNKAFGTFVCFLSVGTILALIGSSLVFVFSHVLREGDKYTFQTPSEFTASRTDTSKYFHKVGIYLKSNNLPIKEFEDSDKDEWIKLVGLTELEKNDCSRQKIKFSTAGDMKFQIKTYFNCKSQNNWTETESINECYKQTNDSFISYTTEPICSNLFNTIDSTGELLLYFNFKSRSSYRLMGDVDYNAHCSPLEKCVSNKIELKYFQARTDNSSHLTSENGDKKLFRFYSLKDLTPIKKAWKTGFIGCDSTSSEAPNHDKNIQV